MIELKNLSKFYNTAGNVAIGLQNINCKLTDGEFVAVVGESGSGKTTFLNVISGIDSYEEGDMLIDGVSSANFTLEEFEEYRKNNVGFIFQNYNLIDSYTVLENVMVALKIKGYDKDTLKSRALEILARVGLKHRVKNRASKLSGGEKQRCVIARALASDARLIACDEPTGNLDSKTGAEIIQLLKEIAKDRLVVMVTHNFDSIKDVATRKIRIHDGQMVEDVNLQTFIEPKEVNKNTIYHMTRKDILRISWKNILYTPKRTILTFFLLISFCFLGSMILFSTKETFSARGSYPNWTQRTADSNPNLMFVTKKNHQVFSEEDFAILRKNAHYLEANHFAVESTFEVRFSNGNNRDDITELLAQSNFYATREGILKKTIVYGKSTIQNGEVILGLSSANYKGIQQEIEKLLNKKITTVNSIALQEKEYTIVGVYLEHNDAMNQFRYTRTHFTDTDYQERLKVSYHESSKEHRYLLPLDQVTSTFSMFTLVKNNNTLHYFDPYIENQPMEKGKIYVKNFTSKTDYCMFYQDYEISLEGYEIVEVNWMSQYYMMMSFETMMELIERNPLEMQVKYEDASTMKEAKARLEATGKYFIMTNYYTEKNLIMDLIAVLGNAFVIIGNVLALFLLFFLTYFILHFIVGSKKKDYNIFRTLGLNKFDLQKVCRYELLSIALFAEIALIVTLVVLRYTITDNTLVQTIFEGVFQNKIFFIIVLIVMLVLVDYLGRRYNKRLFQLTVNQSLKAGDFLD